MSLPPLTADAALYRTRTRYIVSVHNGFGDAGQGFVTLQAGKRFEHCDQCELDCALTNSKCQASASVTYAAAALGCTALVFPPAVAACEAIAAGVYTGAIGGCYAWFGECMVECWWPGGSDCCPVFCELGHCCSEGETCIPHGCCPNDRVICNGICCPQGSGCCGGECLPSNMHCCGSTMCPANVPCCGDRCCDLLPPKGSSPPPPPRNHCVFGGAPCGTKCCPPGLECCGVYDGVPDCKTSCLH